MCLNSQFVLFLAFLSTHCQTDAAHLPSFCHAHLRLHLLLLPLLFQLLFVVVVVIVRCCCCGLHMTSSTRARRSGNCNYMANCVWRPNHRRATRSCHRRGPCGQQFWVGLGWWICLRSVARVGMLVCGLHLVNCASLKGCQHFGVYIKLEQLFISTLITGSPQAGQQLVEHTLLPVASLFLPFLFAPFE